MFFNHVHMQSVCSWKAAL